MSADNTDLNMLKLHAEKDGRFFFEGKEWVPVEQGKRGCKTCHHGDEDGCNHVDATPETCNWPDYRLYERR